MSVTSSSACSREFDLADLEPGSADALHLLAEVFGHAFADAMAWSGDPAGEPALSAALRSPAYAAARARAIELGQRRAAPDRPRRPPHRRSSCGQRRLARHDAGRGRRRRGRHGGRDHDHRPGLRRPRVGAGGRRAAEQRDVELRPAPGPRQLHRAGADAAVRGARDDRGGGRPRRARLRGLRRLPDPLERRARDRQRRSTTGSRRHRPSPRRGSGARASRPTSTRASTPACATSSRAADTTSSSSS